MSAKKPLALIFSVWVVVTWLFYVWSNTESTPRGPGTSALSLAPSNPPTKNDAAAHSVVARLNQENEETKSAIESLRAQLAVLERIESLLSSENAKLKAELTQLHYELHTPPPHAVEMALVEAELKLEVQRLKDEMELQAMRNYQCTVAAEGKGRGVKYIMYFPVDGPNNQLYGFKELITFGRLLNRTIVLPNFLHHRLKDPNLKYKFADFYDPSPIQAAIPAISLEEYAGRCGNRHSVVYLRRGSPDFDEREQRYSMQNGLGKPVERIFPNWETDMWESKPYEPVWWAFKGFTEYMWRYNNVTCLSMGFPYHILQGDVMDDYTARNSRYLKHSPYVINTALEVLKELNLTPDRYIHWRESEEGCQLESDETHEGYDMCFGTSRWSWVKSDDIIEIIKKEMAQYGLEALYLATDSVEDQVIAKFRAAFAYFYTNKDSNILKRLEDNFHRSIIEQEILMKSHLFAGSAYSSWSWTVKHWRDTQPLLAPRNFMLEDLVKKYDKPLLYHYNQDTLPHGGVTFLEARPASCTGNLLTLPQGSFMWSFCFPESSSSACSVISAATSRKDATVEKFLAERGCTVYYLNPSLTREEAEMHVNIKWSPWELDLADYENALTLESFMHRMKISAVNILVLDVQGKEFRVLKKAVKDGSLRGVAQVAARADFAPIWEAHEVHWVKSVARRALLKLNVMKAMAEMGMKIYSVGTDPPNETIRMINWINT